MILVIVIKNGYFQTEMNEQLEISYNLLHNHNHYSHLTMYQYLNVDLQSNHVMYELAMVLYYRTKHNIEENVRYPHYHVHKYKQESQSHVKQKDEN